MLLQTRFSAIKLSLAALIIQTAVGCAAKVDRFTLDRVLPVGVEHADLSRACVVGDALGIPLEALTNKKADLALVFADAASAMCAEQDARAAQLDGALARTNLTGEAMVATARDARIREERFRQIAAYRFDRAFKHLEAHYGTVGETCPKIKEKDEFVYLLGLYAGINGMIMDKASGSTVGVPMDILGKVERGTACLDNAKWWHVPASFAWAGRATLLNTEHGDPWEGLETAAAAGDDEGIRLARAVQVLILANAGKEEQLRAALEAHAASYAEIEANTQWALFDTYATAISLHESDLLWAAEAGHRTPVFGELPGAEAEEDSGVDPFGDDPFGADPFGGGEEPASPDVEDTESPTGDTAESTEEPSP